MNVNIHTPLGILGVLAQAEAANANLTRPFLMRLPLPPASAERAALKEAKRLLEKALNLPAGRLSKPGSEEVRAFGNRTVGVEYVDVFGPATEEAVKGFQRSVSLPVTGDLDAATWSALLNKPVKVSAGLNMGVSSGLPPGAATGSTSPTVAASIPPGAYCLQQLPAGVAGTGAMVKPGGGGQCPTGYKLVVPRADVAPVAPVDPRANAETKIAALPDAALLAAVKAVRSGQGYGDERYEELAKVRNLLEMEAAKRNLAIPAGSDVLIQQGPSVPPTVGTSQSAITAAPEADTRPKVSVVQALIPVGALFLLALVFKGSSRA